jgi:hypothetical protein
MQTLQFRSNGNRIYQVDLPPPLEGLTSAYLFSFHKSGSTLMDNMVRQYCAQFDIPTFSLFNAAFDAGIQTSQIMQDAAVCFSSIGRIYTGFRHYPAFDLDLADVQSILLVRDPRDMLVSHYYSVTRSHVVPAKHHEFQKRRHEALAMDIDEFVTRKADIYLNNFHRYQRKLPEKTLITYRYEDIIYKKAKWLKDIVKKLDLPRDRKLINKTAEKFDIFPGQEDQSKHIRHVHPGNYKTKLKPETIKFLNEKLSEFLRHYKYS